MSKVEEIKTKLARLHDVDALLGLPSRSYPTIHVAGTNGKGSVCTRIAHTLTSMGWKTGLFLSPHIETFRERIQIDGKWITEKEVSIGLNKIIEVSRIICFFDVLFFLASLHFQRHRVDFAVFETGLGGMYDTTNLLLPKVAVITSISLDHADILGNDLEMIATNKAGIIKQNTPVVLGPHARQHSILTKAVLQQAPIYFVAPQPSVTEENKAVARAALKLLLPEKQIELAEISLPCRFERRCIDEVVYIFDGAHNVDAVEKVLQEVKLHYPERHLYVIFALSKTKNAAAIVPMLEQGSDDISYFPTNHCKLASLTQMQDHFPTLKECHLETIHAQAKSKGGIVLVTGSFYLMRDIKQALVLLQNAPVNQDL